MTSSRALEEFDILELLEAEDEGESIDVCSEEEDNVSVDDVQSDYEDDYNDVISDEISEVSPSSINNIEPRRANSTPSRIVTLPQRSLRGKNNHCWSTVKGRTQTRTAALNIVRLSRGPTRMCRNLFEPSLCFDIFLTSEIIEEVVKWTNVEICQKRNSSELSATFRETTADEIRALMGLLTLTAALKDNHLTTLELFDSSFSGSRYVSIMSRDRFVFLLASLRFDDKSIRPINRSEDVFAPIKKIWNLFIIQCRINYTPGSHVTVDEQLLGFRGRCSFRMYIPNKPSKYGLKIPMACDSTTKYMFDAIPYIGKGTETNGLPLGEYYMKELSKTIHGTCRNITCDNWFTSVPLAKSLLQEPYKLTIVGTIRSNKREIPEELKNSRSRAIGTTMFCYDGPLTLLSYKPKPAKVVYLLSSCDEDGVINASSGKPEMIEFYNQTKGGVDSFDQMCSNMSCSRKTNRWPMALFHGMLNMAFVNSYIIYCHNKLSKKEKPLNRREFMKQLSTDLSKAWMEKRLETPTLSRKLRENIQNILPNIPLEGSSSIEDEPITKKRKYCGICSWQKRRKTQAECKKCKKPICGEHKVWTCSECA